MRRAENRRAEETTETPRTLMEIDYLLGVNDGARQGALRFSEKPGSVFLTPSHEEGVPPLILLPKLCHATEKFLASKEDMETFQILLAPGSSLGGARPKASIRDSDGTLALAKFARKDDDFNIVVWEAVALTLAKNAGLNVPIWRLEKFLDTPILVIRRFDREGKNRIPFLSAMSMLNTIDNMQHSYLDLVYALMRYGASPIEDMHQLWRWIIFNILISNTDDHLRNHGFLYERYKGWRLSPAYDINPIPLEIRPRILSTAINYNNYHASLEVALSVKDDFRLSDSTAKTIVKEVCASVMQWKNIAKVFRLKNEEIGQMSSAFEHEDMRKAIVFSGLQ